MPDPPVLINSGEFIFNHIFCLGSKATEISLPAHDNYMKFINNIFI